MNIKSESLSFLFAGICMFLIPIYTYYVPPFVVLWMLSRTIEIIFRKNNHEPIQPANSYTRILAILFIGFFALQVAGLFYSENFENALNVVSSRLLLLVVPLLFIYPNSVITGKRETLLKIFALSTTLYIIYSLIYATIRSASLTEGQIIFNIHPDNLYFENYFRGPDFSVLQHPTYEAMFAVLSLLVSFDFIIERKSRVSVIFWVVTASILLLAIYLLSSRAGFLTALVTLPSYLFIRIRKEKKTLIAVIFIVIIVAASIAIIWTNKRMKYFMEQVSEGSFKVHSKENSRILIWKSALNIVRENILLGVGVGDVRDELIKQYVALDNEDMIKNRYNAHNQFIETTIEGGLLSLAVFISILVYAGYISIVQKNLFLAMFILIMLISFMFETILYRLAGVIYFSLMMFILLQNSSNGKHKE